MERGVRILREHKYFKRDLKQIMRSGRDIIDDLEAVVGMLRTDEPLPERRRDHALSGQWTKIGARDCHVAPDVLLIYVKPPGELHLLRLASHSEIFG